MAQLNFQGIVKTFGPVTAVSDVSMDIASGEFVTLVVDIATAGWLALGLATGDVVGWRIDPGGALVFSAADDASYSWTDEDQPEGGS